MQESVPRNDTAHDLLVAPLAPASLPGLIPERVFHLSPCSRSLFVLSPSSHVPARSAAQYLILQDFMALSLIAISDYCLRQVVPFDHWIR
jgi:hypothetical protein